MPGQSTTPFEILHEKSNCPPHVQTPADSKNYESKLAAFCGLWEDHPRHQYRMEFRLERGQLVGYSNGNQGKALASLDGQLIHMVIASSSDANSPLDHYRGRLGWNKKYINWEKQDASRQEGWRPTRKWVKIE